MTDINSIWEDYKKSTSTDDLFSCIVISGLGNLGLDEWGEIQFEENISLDVQVTDTGYLIYPVLLGETLTQLNPIVLEVGRNPKLVRKDLTNK
jgi:hypothetical protein